MPKRQRKSFGTAIRPPRGQGGNQGTFLPGGAASRGAPTTGRSDFVQKKRGQLHSADGKVPKRCKVDAAWWILSPMGFPFCMARSSLRSFLAISVPRWGFLTISLLQRARNSVGASHSDVWVDVFYFVSFSIISRRSFVVFCYLERNGMLQL